MIERMVFFKDELIRSIEIRTGDQVQDAGMREQHLGYEIAVTTDRRVVTINGCHDASPEFSGNHANVEQS